MKKTKLLLTAAGLFFSVGSYAQLWTLSGADVTTTTTGNCTIGGKLYVQAAEINMTQPGSIDDFRAILGHSNTQGLLMMANTGGNNGAGIELYGGNETLRGRPGQIYYWSNGTSVDGHVFYNHNPSTSFNNILMRIQNNGDVSITGGLNVKGGLIDLAELPGADGWRNIVGHSATQGVSLVANTGAHDGAAIELNSSVSASTGRPGQIYYWSNGTSVDGHVFYNHNPSTSFNNILMRIQNNGDVSITGGLNVKGGLIDLTELPGADGWRNILGHSATQGISLVANTGAHDGAAIELNSSVSASTGRPGTIHYYSQGDELNQYGHVFINNRTDISNRALMGIKKDGKVVIGENLVWGAPPSGMASTTPGNYLLYVEKGILTEKLKVANRTDFMNWSDFVFNKDYQLMPLAELESYINTNKHLPEIPTADEVAKDGIDVAEMDAKLLQKIEELTLYVIQLEKDMHELKKNKLSK